MGKNWYENKLKEQQLGARAMKVSKIRKLLKLPPLKEVEEKLDAQHNEWKLGNLTFSNALAAAGYTFKTTYGSYTTTYNASSTMSVWDEDSEPAYERETLPILAQRYAGLALIPRRSEIRFTSIVSGHGSFGIDEVAVCKRNPPSHRAPEWECVCGFYAVPADKLPNHDNGLCTKAGDRNQIILQVELFGKVIIHDEGYRAECQKVLEVRVPDCHCGEPSKFIWLNKKTGLLERVDCGQHKTPQIVVPEWVDEAVEYLSEKSIDPTAAAHLEQALQLAGIYEAALVEGHDIESFERRLGIPFTRYEK